MKNNELRIGNYVQHNDEIIKVEQITKRKIGYHRNGDKSRMHYLKYSEIKPIEITEDLLLKNGFKKKFNLWFSQDCFVYNDNEVILRQSFDDGSWYAMIVYLELDMFSINYIHKLQNAYYIFTKKELHLQF